MKDPILFLNELSLDPDVPPGRPEVLQAVLTLLDAIRRVKKIRANFSVVSGVPFSGLSFCSSRYALADLLRDDRDQWRLIQSLRNASPWDSHAFASRPEDTCDISFQNKTAIGMMWAFRNESFILSFGLSPVWVADEVEADLRSINSHGEIEFVATNFRNISNGQNVERHRQQIVAHGTTESASSIIFSGEGFVVRMYFKDHNPPHFHVMLPGNTTNTIAKYEIATLDLMKGQLPSTVRRRVQEWARQHKTELMANWSLCQSGQKPMLLED